MDEIRAAAIVLAAGAGRRVGGDVPKAFLPIAGRPILAVAAASAAAAPEVGRLVITAPAGWEDEARAVLAGAGVSGEVAAGGATRQESVRIGLELLAPDVELVVIHDAARPFATPDLFSRVIRAVADGSACGAVPVVPVTDTVKRVEDDRIVATESRAELALAQTPQAFRADELRAAHARAVADGVVATDDAALLERLGDEVLAVPGDALNRKITTMLDLARADAWIGEARG